MARNKRLIRKWKKLLDEVINDLTNLMEGRYVFNEIVSICKENENLKEDNIFWQFLRINYVSSAVLNICRQVDTNHDSLSLINLLNEILQNSNTITKRWFASQYQKNIKGDPGKMNDFKKIMFGVGKADFENNFGKRNFIRKSMMSSDILKLKRHTKSIKKFRHKGIAHLDKNRKLKFNISFNDLNNAIDVLEKTALKYNLLLNQAAYAGGTLLPTIQYDWKMIFKEPWIK